MKERKSPDFTLEYLLDFDGRVHFLENGCWLKFEIKRVPAAKERPHGLYYSFTLHAQNGTRLLGFDNAHGVPALGSKLRARPEAHDHWHRTEKDSGRPYKFIDAETLITDFETEVERILAERDSSTSASVVSVTVKGRRK